MITLKRDEKEKESEASAVKRGRWTKEDLPDGPEKKRETESEDKEEKSKTEEEQMETTTETSADIITGNY